MNILNISKKLLLATFLAGSTVLAMQDESSVIFSLPGAPPLQENYAEAPCLDYFSNIPDQVVVLFILPQIPQSPTINSVSEICNATKQLVKLRAVCKIFSNLLTNENIRQILTNSGFDLSIINEKVVGGFTPLVNALFYKYLSKQIPPLIILGANPDSMENANIGQLPLHFAITTNNITVVEILLTHGANPNSKIEGSNDSLEGKTALQVALHYHNREIIKLLIDHGATIDAELAIAIQNSNTDTTTIPYKHKKPCKKIKSCCIS